MKPICSIILLTFSLITIAFATNIPVTNKGTNPIYIKTSITAETYTLEAGKAKTFTADHSYLYAGCKTPNQILRYKNGGYYICSCGNNGDLSCIE